MRKLGIGRRTWLRIGVVVVALTLSSCGTEDDVVVPIPAIPELRLGMSIDEAKREFGPRFLLPSWHLNPSADCNYFELDGSLVSGLVIAKEIATVDIEAERDSEWRVVGPGPVGLRGLRAGQTLEQVVERFGRPDRISTAESSGGEMLLWQIGDLEAEERVFLRANIYDPSGRSENAVSSLEIGIEPYIFYGEGCA
jgi:hypothetical protein